jgi:heme a synthase
VFLLLGLTVAAVVLVRTGVDTPPLVRRAADTVLAVELAQGVIGFVQYFTGLPVVLVALHVLGAALLSAAMTWLLLAVRERTPV